MSQIRALLFDMDGTIVDNMSFHTDTWLELLRRHEIETTAEEFFKNTAGMPNATIFRHYFGDRLTEDEIVRFGDEKEVIYRDVYAPHVKAMDGLDDLLERAKAKGIKTGLATSAPPENIEFILGKTGLHASFDVIVGARDVQRGKPDPQIYEVCMERLGVTPEESVVFEDAPVGVESGVRSGARVFVVTTVLTADEATRLPGIELVVTDFHEAVEALGL